MMVQDVCNVNHDNATWWKIRSNILNADKMLLNDEYDEELFVDSSETFSIAFTEPFQLLRNFSTT